MAEQSRPPDPLVVWALASFHAGFLVAGLVTLIHAFGSLGDLLAGLNTAVGLALYLVLWATTWWTTRKVLTQTAIETAPVSSILKRGLLWGGVNGVGFLLGIVLIALAPQFLFEGEFVPLLFITGIGSVFALVLGAIIGCLFGVFDVLLFRMTGFFVRSDDPPRSGD